jgi:hypothetical protein
MNMHETGGKNVLWLIVAVLLALAAIAATVDVEDHSETQDLTSFCSHDYC